MKLILFFLFYYLSSNVFGQSTFEIQTDERTSKPMLVGTINRGEIQKTVFNEWWSEEYNKYEVDILTADEIIPFLEEITIRIIAASWCSDSREHIPRFYKVLDYLAFPEEDIKLVFVNRNKTALSDEVIDLNLDFVPTIIFYKDKTELGRIVELPYESLELDMLSILFVPAE